MAPRYRHANGSIANTARDPQNHLSRDKYDLNVLKEDLIFESTQHHVSFTFNGNTLEGLDKYNDATRYGITTEKEDELIRQEIDRLALAAKTNDASLFDSASKFNSSPETALQELADLAE
jgi:hypothetical protein